MNKHTPGQWHIGHTARSVTIGTRDGLVAAIPLGLRLSDSEQAAANARLIAEAPAMYEALRQVRKHMSAASFDYEPMMEAIEAVLDRIDGAAVRS